MVKECYPSGAMYKGYFIDGMRHGYGKYLTVDDAMYKGEWLQGIREGYGVWTHPDGSKYKGNFKND